MRYLLIVLVFTFAAFGYAQDKIDVRSLDTLHKEKIKKVHNDTAQVNSLLKIAGWHLKAMTRKEYKRSADSVVYYSEKPLSTARQHNNGIGESNALLMYSAYAFGNFL